MVEDSVTVRDPAGLHARSARELVDRLADYESEVRLSRADVEAVADSIMQIMMLAATPGSELTVKAEGPDEEAALDAVRAFFREDGSENESDV